MRIAVLGATGFVGRAVVPVLLGASHEVTAVSRRAPPSVRPPGCRWIVADVTDPAGVRRALEGVDVVHYLVHSLGAKDFEERDRASLGSIHADLSAHLRSRCETGQRLAAGNVPVTTLRAAIVNGDSVAFATILALVDRLPAVICPRWDATETQATGLADIVRYLAGVPADLRAGPRMRAPSDPSPTSGSRSRAGAWSRPLAWCRSVSDGAG